MATRARAAVDALSPRERTLLAIAAGLGLVVAVGAGALAVRDDLDTLRARVGGRERELREVRRLAAALRRAGPAPDAGGVPIARLEAVVDETVGRERIAGMTPAASPDEPVALRVSGASLAELVRLMHALETGPPPLAIVRLELKKLPDDQHRFDATLEVARGAGGAP
jgi:Type II secretion system (T2SS), protein M